MFLLQPGLELIHFLQSVVYYFWQASYFIGRNIFLLLVRLCGIIRDFFSALVIIGEELYLFLCELDASLNSVARYVHSSTNNGVNCFLEAVALFCRKMSSFFLSTRMYSRLLATKSGSCVIDFLELVRDALLLIADCIWWLLTFLPRTIIGVLITVGDGFVFGINALGRGIAGGVRILVDDIFRLTIGAAVLFLLLRHRRCLVLLLIHFIIRIKTWLRLSLHSLRLCWNNIRRRGVRGRNDVVSSPSVTTTLRRTTLPRGSRSPSSASDKVSELQMCVVCRDRPKCVLLLPCKHLCLCEECADYMVFETHSHHCPLCRGQVVHSMSVYI